MRHQGGHSTLRKSRQIAPQGSASLRAYLRVQFAVKSGGECEQLFIEAIACDQIA